MTTEIKCPYCTKYIELDTGDHCEGHQEYECPKCQKNFEVFAEPTVRYSACEKADCLNGGEHVWKRQLGAPTIHFMGRYLCENCSARKVVESELATKEEYDAYFKDEDKADMQRIIEWANGLENT